MTRHSFIATTALATALLVPGLPAYSADELTVDMVLAALDGLDGPASCGQDGACNFAVCSNDPDCPDDLPGHPDDTSSPAPPSRPEDIKDCDGTQGEIGRAIDWGADHWAEFEAVLEDIRDWPVDIGNCLENRFKKNGKVVCEARTQGECASANGWASPFNKRAHMCPTFLNIVATLPDPAANRQACYFALAAHEWGHTCERGHKTLEIIDDEAFDFWKSRHPEVTISFSDCNMG